MPSSVRAHTTATSATEPLVIHILWPCRIQSSPSRRARVRIAPGSEPASGSVRPKQPIASPAAIRGSHCVLLLLRAPAVDREHRQRPLHRHQAAQPAVARPRAPGRPARRRSRWRRRSRSPPGACRARRSCPAPCASSSGIRASSNQSPTYGSTWSVTNARTVSRIIRSSSSRRSSMPRKSWGRISRGVVAVISGLLLCSVPRASPGTLP